MRRIQATRFSALATIAVCGLACAAFAAQPSDHDSKKRDHAKDMASPITPRMPVFVSGKKIAGMTVKNSEDKSLGTVDDLIMDRGSGRINYLVLKSGAVLGMGGKLVTVPYNAFGWDGADKHISLMATPEEIKAWPEFDKKRWMEGTRTDDSYIRVIGKDYYDTTNSPWPAEVRADAAPTTVKGTVKTISRRPIEGGREELVVIVATPDKGEREIIMGPSWYMAGNNTIAFYRDAPINVDVFDVSRQGRSTLVARTAQINGKTFTFYDAAGKPTWYTTSTTDPFMNAPFILFSEIKGKNVDCRGEKCGDVADVVVECTSGRATFLVIDPDKAFLGIGDENRLVPWSIMTRSPDGIVHLDANKSMITSGPTAPKELKDLADENNYRRVYATYDVMPANYDVWRR